MPDLVPGRIKICGITRLADACAAIACGVSTLGFVFHPPSPRAVTPRQAREIIQELGQGILAIGVFVDARPQEINEVAAESGLAGAQLHGTEPEEWLDQIAVPTIKAFRVRSQHDLPAPGSYSAASAFLLDAWSPEAAGGTGQAWDWRLVREETGAAKPIILAGGLNPSNVAAAIRHVRPVAVDVSSGVEAAPGVKDHDRMQCFVRNALEAFDGME